MEKRRKYSVFRTSNELYVDTNGLHKGPNTLGRDIFVFHTYSYQTGETKIVWEGSDNAEFRDGIEEVCDNNSTGYTCAGKLLQERKMNY